MGAFLRLIDTLHEDDKATLLHHLARSFGGEKKLAIFRDEDGQTFSAFVPDVLCSPIDDTLDRASALSAALAESGRFEEEQVGEENDELRPVVERALQRARAEACEE